MSDKPMFERDTALDAVRYYDPECRRTLIVAARSDGVELRYHMHAYTYTTLTFSPAEARAIAAELVAAADAVAP